jgi:hypothetical protein
MVQGAMGRVLLACLLCLGTDISATQSQRSPQVPPLAVELIDKLVAVLKQTEPENPDARVGVLREQLLGMATRTQRLNFKSYYFEGKSDDNSLEATLSLLARGVVTKIIEAANAKKNGQETEQDKAIQEICGIVTNAYLLVGMGNSPLPSHMMAAMTFSLAAISVGIGITSVPLLLGADKDGLAGDITIGAFIVAVLAYGSHIALNLWRLDIREKMPRFYPGFLKNSLNLALNRNAVDARFWRIVAKNMNGLAGSDPNVSEFLNDWLPDDRHHRLWSTTVRGLRRQNTSPLQRFFETLKTKFDLPGRDDCAALLGVAKTAF